MRQLASSSDVALPMLASDSSLRQQDTPVVEVRCLAPIFYVLNAALPSLVETIPKFCPECLPPSQDSRPASTRRLRSVTELRKLHIDKSLRFVQASRRAPSAGRRRLLS